MVCQADVRLSSDMPKKEKYYLCVLRRYSHRGNILQMPKKLKLLHAIFYQDESLANKSKRARFKKNPTCQQFISISKNKVLRGDSGKPLNYNVGSTEGKSEAFFQQTLELKLPTDIKQSQQQFKIDVLGRFCYCSL